MASAKSNIIPHAFESEAEIMPTDSCQYFYECENFKKVIKKQKCKSKWIK